MMHGYGMMGGFGIFGIISAILHVLFWVAIIYLIFTAIKKLNVKDVPKTPIEAKDSSIQILKERYARGEISEEEYKKMKANLTD
jgi:uncharacterized membrane protein